MKLLIALLITVSIVVVESFEASEDKEAETFLKNFYDFNKDGNLKSAVKELQSMAGLAPTGNLDEETKSYLRKDRCGGKDTKRKFNKRYNLPGSKWDKGKTYYYFIHTFDAPDTMEWGEVRRAIYYGLGYWSGVSDIKFQEAGGTRGCSFSMSFAGRDHKKFDINNNFQPSTDPYPLDNVPGAVLAHCFYPRDGNMHYDNAEKWTEYTDDGINLRIVTAHEIGHGIGIAHSADPKALMAPWYGGFIKHEDYILPDDDTKAAIALYGPAKSYHAVNVKRDDNPVKQAFCNSKKFVAAFTFSDGHTYIVSNGSQVFQLTENGVNASFKSEKLSKELSDIDAAFYDDVEKRLVVFRGEELFALTGDSLSNLKSTKLESKKGTFSGKATAAFAHVSKHGKSKGVKRFWVVENNELISGILTKNNAILGRRSRHIKDLFKMGNGDNLPSSIDAGVVVGQDDKQHLLLFVGNSVYVANPGGKRMRRYLIPSSYPKPIKVQFGC